MPFHILEIKLKSCKEKRNEYAIMEKLGEGQEDMFMYERMLNKQEQPRYNEMCAHCEECGELFIRLNTWLFETFATQQEVTFPYGNHYGWGIAHRKKKKLMCKCVSGGGSLYCYDTAL